MIPSYFVWGAGHGTRYMHGVAGDEEAPDARTEEVGNRLQPAYEELYGGRRNASENCAEQPI